jgi:glycosyltransferase involved in cell wall biosynthesis
VFAYLGRLDIRHKGLDVLVKGLARAQSDSNLCLVLIGPDRTGARRLLQRLARRSKCEGQVRFLGPHFGDDKWKLLRMADAFISPSRWDAFPIAAAEAIAFGLPTIVSRGMNPGLEYMAAGAALAVRTSPGALGGAMRQLANDPHLRQSLSEHGRKYVLDKCSPWKAGARFKDFYLQVLRAEKVFSPPPAQPRAIIQDKAARAVVNVIHVFPYSPAVSGGHSNAIRSFIACQRAKGINAVAIAPKPEAEAAETRWEFPLAEIDSLWNLRWPSIAERFGITSVNSLLNLHSVNHRFAPFLGDLRQAGVPYVLTSHGQLNFRNAAHWLKKFVYLNFLDRGPRKAAGLHLLTTLADRRLDLLMPGYSGQRLIQGNVVSLPNLAELPAGSRSDFDLPPDAFVLVFMGRLDVWVKGLDLLVEAFACLPSERFRLVMAGPDWQGGKAKLEQLAQRFGCRNRIHFVGPVYGEKKWSLLRMADLFVSPARWDAFSVAHAEALALGLPLVTSDRIAMAADLREADAALLAPLAVEPLAKAICSLEADQELRRTLGNRGKAWAEMNCNPDRAGLLFREYYQSILDRASNPRG